MSGFGCAVSGSVQETTSGAFVAYASAIRTWEHFTVQTARLTSVACRSRTDAELMLQSLLDDLRAAFAP